MNLSPSRLETSRSGKPHEGQNWLVALHAFPHWGHGLSSVEVRARDAIVELIDFLLTSSLLAGSEEIGLGNVPLPSEPEKQVLPTSALRAIRPTTWQSLL